MYLNIKTKLYTLYSKNEKNTKKLLKLLQKLQTKYIKKIIQTINKNYNLSNTKITVSIKLNETDKCFLGN